ncbi:MAG: sugar ABC transporter ATP-binding protein [Sphaerochaetaceae bacterium]
MEDVFLEARNISKTFVGVKALDDVDLTIGKGEIHCLIGENGSGKSTLIKIIGGIHKADSGTIAIDGNVLSGKDAIESIRAGVQIIYQDLSLFPNLTVAENISINQMLETNQQFVNWKKVRETAKRALSEIGEDIDIDERVENLSVAKKQIIAISRALTQNAKLIIMDEATSAITSEEVKHLFTIILKLKERGIATLFVSHKLSEVFEIAENITILRDGKLLGVYPSHEVNEERLAYIMTGLNLKSEPYVYEATKFSETPLLEVKNLTKKGQYNDVSFHIKPGEIVGVIGLIGSGRTEVVESIFGIDQPDSGSIYVRGEEVAIRNPRDAMRHGIAFLPEDRLTQGLFDVQSIGNNIVITVIKNFLKRSKLLDLPKKKNCEVEWVQKLAIKTPTPKNPANSLSGGNQQRVVIAKWLATDPKVFILDGPTIGIDIGSKHTIHEIIRDLARQGMGILIISDEAQEILDNCNRGIVMSNGRIIREFSDSRTIGVDELLDIVARRVESGAGA